MKTVRTMLACYLIAGTQDCRHLRGNTPETRLLNFLQAAIDAGITAFQFREKGVNALQHPARIYRLAMQCRSLCRQRDIPFWVNDDIALACAVMADGVHIGQDDTPPEQAKARCGNMILGLSVNTLAQAQTAAAQHYADYFGVGPIFATTSKADAQAATGTALLRDIRRAGIDQPLVAIGGITETNAAEILAAGADGVAVISALTRSGNLPQTVQRLTAR